MRTLSILLTALMLAAQVELRADVILAEFMASNSETLYDDFGESSDWIEVYNSGQTNVNLFGWSLTDNAGNLTKWQFPATNLAPGATLIVFASNRDRHTAGQTLHTSFKLSAAGEYLALVRPDGTIATEFAPTYPPQVPDVSFGLSVDTSSLLAVSTGSVGRVTVPVDASIPFSWVSNSFNDASWTVATNGIGFTTDTNLLGDTLSDTPLGYWRLNETVTNGGAANLGSLGSGANGQYLTDMTVNVVGPQPTGFPGFESTNTCARFDAASSRMEVPYNAALNPDGPFSVELWVKPAEDNGTYQCPLSSINFSGSAREGYIFYQYAGSDWQFRMGNSGGYVATASGGVPAIGAWTHLVGVYDGSTAKLYVNGSNVASTTLSGTFSQNTAQVFRLGATGSGSGTLAFNGDTDEVSFHNRVLTAAEIAGRFDTAVSSSFSYASLIKTDMRTAMDGVNAGAYSRLPFVLTNTPVWDQVTLRVKYDDGFMAQLNGATVASGNAPVEPVWNSTATSAHPASGALAFESFNLTGFQSLLQTGTNILALHGLNLSATDSDFLLLAELEMNTIAYQSQARYFVVPTPDGLNGTGAEDLGPIMTSSEFFPQLPGTSDSLTITCRVTEAFAPVSNVTLHWRLMFDSINTTTMYDDGLHGDGAAGDSVYGAAIPSTGFTSGSMVRWYLTANDSLTNSSRWPLFEDPANSAEYLGTVIEPGYVTSTVPVLHLFAPANVLNPGPTTSQTGADSETGGRVSAYFDGEFYDNIYMELRGNSTANYNKNSHSFKFNDEHKFRHAGPGGRIRKTSFTADYPDTTYMRQGLSFWLCNEFGAPGPFYEPYRLQLNGGFYQMANHNDVLDSELLDRLGYDPDGALYKAAGIINPGGTSTGGFDKKTRTWESNSDYVAFANAIAESLSTSQRRTNLFDRLDLPQIINYLVVARFVHENDDVWANMSVYHDNDGDDLWRIVPFDMNLSWGAAYVDSGSLVGIQSTNDSLKSHPLYGSSQTIWNDTGNWNRMYDLIFQVPQTREMFLRRMRTFLDTWVKPPGTPTNQLPIEARVLASRDLIQDEANRDRNWWGWAPNGGQNNLYPDLYLDDGVNELLNEFLAVRRQHFYGKHSVSNTALPIGITKADNAGIPLAQPTNAIVSIVSWDYNPVSGNQDEEYICITNANSFAVDISDWKLGGGVTHKLQPGTVIPAGGALYVSPNSRTFRDRAVAPHGGMGLFVQGGYNGHLNAWGESMTLTDTTGRLISSNSFVGTPSLAQQFLRVTEVMYNPSPAPAITNDAQLFEYIELRNISTSMTLDLNGVRFTNGISFTFTGSAVTSLAPNQRVLVVRDTAAFTARYGGGSLIAGDFLGALDSSGESVRLNDAVGEKILEFSYNNSWYSITDGLGFSLVIVNDLAPWFTWGDKASWRPSGVLNGSPGSDDAVPAWAPILVNEVLAHTDLPDRDSIELFNPTATNVNLGGWFLTDDFFTPKKYRIANGTTIPAGGHLVFTDAQFNTGPKPFLLSEYGESAYLFSGDATTNLTGHVHGYDFAASPNGVSFGRHIDSQTNEHFVLQSINTLNGTNALPRVGPVVVSEVMYHPPDYTNAVDNSVDEYIELQNITPTNVPLYSTVTNEPGYGLAALTNTWRLRNAVDFDFPTNTSLAANSRLLVVGFDPSTNATQLASFRALYSVSPTMPVFGPWSGKLDNSSETIELKSPGKPDVATNVFVPYIMIDRVSYSDDAPWPTNADGLGNSLQRLVNSFFGNDPANWFASGPTAGQGNLPNILPSVEMTAPTNGATLGRIPGIQLAATASDTDGTVNKVSFLDGATLITTLTASPWIYLWTNAPFGVRTLTAVAEDDAGGTAQSTTVSVTVTSLPPTVTLVAPTNGQISVAGTSVMLSATASDPDSSVDFVDFYDNGSLLGAVPAPGFSLTWIPATGGNHVISAVARDDSGGTSAPATAGVFVQAVANLDSTLVASNSSWAYFDQGTDPGSTWMDLAYDDSGWSNGFAELGYGDVSQGRSEATLISFGPNPSSKYPAYYFRQKFVSQSPEQYSSGLLKVMHDDGAIAYLNGVEVFREGMPAGPVSYLTFANWTASLADEYTMFPTNFSPNLLIAGTNILAVEVHQDQGGSSDVSFASELSVSGRVVAPAITTQPQSQTVTNGQSAAFDVVVSGTPSFNYQWNHANTNLPGAISAMLTLPVVTTNDAGGYFVTVTNAAGSVTSVVAMLTVINADADTDSDGMPDAWEQAHGLTVGVNDANLDLDLDGMSNIDEFLSKTLPNDASSVLKLDPADVSGGNVLLTFKAQADLGYTVQYLDVLSTTNWQFWMQVNPAPTNRMITITNSTPLTPKRFFRVRTPPTP